MRGGARFRTEGAEDTEEEGRLKAFGGLRVKWILAWGRRVRGSGRFHTENTEGTERKIPLCLFLRVLRALRVNRVFSPWDGGFGGRRPPLQKRKKREGRGLEGPRC